MPWFGSKKTEPAPPPPTDAPLADPSAPLRFRIDDVYTITGLGCVAVGEVIDGAIRVPMSARRIRPSGAVASEMRVTIKSAQAHHQPVTEVRPGTSVGLQLGGVPRMASPLARHFYDVVKGDELVNP